MDIEVTSNLCFFNQGLSLQFRQRRLTPSLNDITTINDNEQMAAMPTQLNLCFCHNVHVLTQSVPDAEWTIRKQRRMVFAGSFPVQ
ncbi:hypothetical protein [Dickeya oryzae]